MDKNGQKSVKTPTLKDVAAVTGYSVNTVSRALRDMNDIAPETRRKIKQAALEMGHISNTLASSLRLGFTNTIAVILGDVSNPHFGIMMSQAEQTARRLGYSCFIINSDEDEAVELKAITMALNKSVDGIILCPAQHGTENVEYLKRTGKPFVLLGRRFENVDTDYVVCDDENGGYIATRRLIQNGHEKILLLCGAPYISSSRERLAGYMRAHEEAGIAPTPELIRYMDVTASDCESVIKDVLQSGQEFSAVFAFSDMIAWKAWSILKKQGLRVPEDVSIIGFDDIGSKLSLPFELCSIRTEEAFMASIAVNALAARIKGEAPDERMHDECVHRVLKTALREGDTVAPVR